MQKKPYIILACMGVFCLVMFGYVLQIFTKDSKEISGLYFYQEAHMIESLKFRKVDDNGTVVADYKSIEMKEDGHLESITGVAYGPIKGQNLALSIRVGTSFSPSLFLNGVVKEETLELTLRVKEQEVGTRIFVRGTNDDYMQEENTLKQKAMQALAKEQAKKKARVQELSREASINKLDETSRQLTALYNVVDDRLARASSFTPLFEANTKRSQVEFERMGTLSDWRAKSDLVLQLQQIANDTEQLNTQLKSLEDEFLAQISVINVGLVDAEKTCVAYKNQVPTLKEWCERFVVAHKAFKDKIAGVRNHFKDVNVTFYEELRKQNVMARSAEKILNAQ